MVGLPASPTFRLDGKRALVTGAGRGIGLAAAAALADAGASVTLTARSAAELEAAAEGVRQTGGSAETLVLDVTNTGAVRSALSALPAFEILVNNAGMNRPRPFMDVAEADFDDIFRLNVRAAFFVAQAAARGMIEAGRGGSIVNMSSQMGHVGAPNRSVYCASKFAMEGMTKAMAVELGAHRIRVNTICPTFVETSMTGAALIEPAFRDYALGKIKLGRIGAVEDLTGAIVFLSSDASSLMTGSALMIDGGWTAE